MGHGRRDVREFVAVLQSVGVTRVVDIRAFPRSRSNPQFNVEVLEKSLARWSISYTHLSALGGRRGTSKAAEHDNDGWQVSGFRNYANYAHTAEFREGLRELLSLASRDTCAVMCAETVWWRCHRRIVADYVLAQGVPVVHLLSESKRTPAALTEFARVEQKARISYPGSPQ